MPKSDTKINLIIHKYRKKIEAAQSIVKNIGSNVHEKGLLAKTRYSCGVSCNALYVGRRISNFSREIAIWNSNKIHQI